MGTTLLLIGAFLPIAVCTMTHFVIAPLVNHLYYTYEPLMFHYVYKFTCRKKRAIEKVQKSYLKVRGFISLIRHKFNVFK